MSNYTKTTNFLVKDGLAAGSPAKLIKGSEFDVEFNAIQTSIATKANLISPAFTGSASAQTLGVSVALNSTGTTTLAGTLAGTFTIDGGTF